MTYRIYIKSHTEAPDFEAEIEASNPEEATERFYEMLQGEFDRDFIRANIIEE